MKRVVIGLVICCLLELTGCSKQEEFSEKNGNSEELYMEESGADLVEENTDEDKKEYDINLPDGFIMATQEEMDEIPDAKGLLDAAGNALGIIGIVGNMDVIFGNYRALEGLCTIDAYGITPQEIGILMSFQYISIISSPQWNTVYVKDADTKNTYYVPDDLRNTVDLYDYSTGKLISPKSEDYEDVQERIDEKVKEAESEFEENMENLKDETAKTWYVSELELDGELIVDSTVSEMVAGYDYIKDIVIEVDESEKEIDIVVQVSSLTDADTAQMAGEDVARYLAAQASYATNSYRTYKIPGSDDLGSLYEQYDLLIYVDDGNHTFDIYGAKVTSSKSITWR